MGLNKENKTILMGAKMTKQNDMPTMEEYEKSVHMYRHLAERVIDDEIKSCLSEWKFSLLILGITSVSSIVITCSFGVGLGEWLWQMPVCATGLFSIAPVFLGKKYYKKKKFREKEIMDYEKELMESSALASLKW